MYSGGVGSYALLVMVAGFLLLHPSREVQGSGKKARPGQLEPCLGILLLDFMRFYGRTINPNKCGISCRLLFQSPVRRGHMQTCMQLLLHLASDQGSWFLLALSKR